MPRRIQRRRSRGWRLPAHTVNVTRPGRYGNPFKVGIDGTRAECVALFRQLLAGICPISDATAKEQKRVYLAVRHGMAHWRGWDVACWCPLDAECHGDVLLACWNQPEEA